MKTIHRDTVCAYIVSADRKLLLGQKDPAKGGVYADCWHTPGGGIDDGETPQQAVAREVREETGLDVANGLVQLVDDRGTGESVKQRPGEDDVLVQMTFAVYKVVLSMAAADVVLHPADDLINLTWFDLDKLDAVRQTPPAYALIERIGSGWLTGIVADD